MALAEAINIHPTEEFNVNPITPTQDEPFNVDNTQESNPAPITPEVAATRSSKFKYGLGELIQQSKDEIYQGLINGEESNIRTQVSGEIDKRKQEQTQKLIAQVVGNKGGPLTSQETSGLVQIIGNMTPKTDPASVFEEAYGKQFMSTLEKTADRNPDNFFNDARKQNPEEVASILNTHTGLVSKREYAITLAENIEAEVHSQGWTPWLADRAKEAVPFYKDAKLRGNADVSIFSGFGLGYNLEEQRKTLLRLPFDEYKTALNGIANTLRKDNPGIAAEFVRSVVGMSSDEVFVDNLELPTSLIGTGIVGSITKAGYRVIRGGAAVAAEDIPKLVRRNMMTGEVISETPLKDVQKAAKDLVIAGGDQGVSKSSLEAAAGDLQEAAVTRATTNAVSEAKGYPRATEKAIEALPEVLRTDIAEVRAAPGRFGQDLVNRIEENSNTITTQFLDAVKTISKVERLPEIMSNETAVRAILESIKDTYKGLRNSVLDISKPYKEPIANTWLADMRIGKNDGTFFEQRSVAENFAKFHGLTDAEVLPGYETKFTKDAVRAAKLEKDIAVAEKGIASNQKILDDTKASEKARTRAGEQVEGLTEFRDKYVTELNSLNQKTTVEQQGLGFYIKVTKPINETDPVVRSFIAETKNTKIPDGAIQRFFTNFLGKYRTPEEVLSLAERQNRLISTYTPSVYFDIMKENAIAINSIRASRFSPGRKKWKEWQRVLENGQTIKDPNSTDEVGGYFFKSPQELEEKYLQWFNRLPDRDEIVAYFEFKRGMEMDRMFRNIAEHRNQQRVGAETHKIVTTDAEGKQTASPEFSGVTRKKLSSTEDNVLIMGDKLGDERVRSLQLMSTADRKALQEEIDKGSYKFIELYAPEHRPLNGFGEKVGNTRVRYVLAKTSEVRQLDWNQIPRRGGGHIEYEYDWYIKQAKIMADDIGGKHWYEGDTTIMPIQLRAMGEKVAEHLNKVRELLKDKKPDEARDYSNRNLHIDWEKVNGWFTSGKDAEGKFKPAQISLREPIRVIHKNETLVNVDKELERRYAGFKNGMKEGSLAKQAQVEFSGQRDAYDVFTLKDVGTRHNPLYQVAPAEMVDPITTMNRGLTRIAKSNFLDDYKTMSVEHWLKQASTHLDATDSEIWHSPYYYFNYGKFKTNTPPDVKAALEASRIHTLQLTGVPSSTDALLHSYSQKLADSVYKNLGPKGIVIDPSWMLPKIRDPFRFIRSVIYNAKMGLFNIPQFIVQAGNYSNIYGIAGHKFAAPGTYAAQLHFWSTVNSHPAIIDHLDTLATKLIMPGAVRWRPGEFKEAMQELHKTGFGTVRGEYAVVDNPASEKIIGDGIHTFLDWGQFPVRAGERNSRYGAWYTAYKEFREANPTGRITDEDRAAIFQRADLLNVNMSRASNSALHTGWKSVPTQFYTYQIRLFELFYGSRLTTTERARMFATNAALYGVPMATGLTGLPFADFLRKKSMEGSYGNDPYVVGDKLLPSLAMEGLVSAIGAVVTGKGDPRAGTWFDVGPRYGSKGFEFLGGMNSYDKGYMDIIGGPAWSVAKGTAEQKDGLMNLVGSMLHDGGELFPPTVEDVIDIFKEITSVNTAMRTIAAAQVGHWISKREAYLADTSTGHAVFSAISGLKDQQINDIQTMTASMRDQKDYETKMEKMFDKEFRRGVLAQKDNPEQAKKYFTRATRILELGGYPEDRLSEVVAKAVRDNQSILDKVSFDFYIKKAPDALKEQRGEAMQRLLKLKETRGQE